jgi:hypothetical protein
MRTMPGAHDNGDKLGSAITGKNLNIANTNSTLMASICRMNSE